MDSHSDTLVLTSFHKDSKSVSLPPTNFVVGSFSYQLLKPIRWGKETVLDLWDFLENFAYGPDWTSVKPRNYMISRNMAEKLIFLEMSSESCMEELV